MMEENNDDDRDDEEEEEEWRVKPEDEVGEVKRWCVRWWRRGYMKGMMMKKKKK